MQPPKISMARHISTGLLGAFVTGVATYSILEGWPHGFSAVAVSGVFLLLYPTQPPLSGLFQDDGRK